jgi:hypothetical protein
MFLGLPNPDPLVTSADPAPDPSIIKQKSKKNLDLICKQLVYDFLLQNEQ